MTPDPSLVAALREFLGTPNTTVYWDAECIARAFEAGVEAAMWCAVTHGHAPDKQRALSAFVASLKGEAT
jgi:hypothetical protein